MTIIDSQFIALIQAAISLANSCGKDIQKSKDANNIQMSMTTISRLGEFAQAHDAISDALDLVLLQKKNSLQ